MDALPTAIPLPSGASRARQRRSSS